MGTYVVYLGDKNDPARAYEIRVEAEGPEHAAMNAVLDPQYPDDEDVYISGVRQVAVDDVQPAGSPGQVVNHIALDVQVRYAEGRSNEEIVAAVRSFFGRMDGEIAPGIFLDHAEPFDIDEPYDADELAPPGVRMSPEDVINAGAMPNLAWMAGLIQPGDTVEFHGPGVAVIEFGEDRYR